MLTLTTIWSLTSCTLGTGLESVIFLGSAYNFGSLFEEVIFVNALKTHALGLTVASG